MATGKYEAAIEDFNAALNVNANNSEAWTGLGVLLREAEQSLESGRILPTRGDGQSQQQRGARGLAAVELTRGGLRQRLDILRGGAVFGFAREKTISIT